MDGSFDPYLILGISASASADDIHRAYRRLATTMHPDLNQEDARATSRFQQVQRAYNLLRDANKRRAYDGASGSNSSHAESHDSQASTQEMTCPICGGRFAVSDSELLQTFHCPLCNTHLTMPGTESAPPPPPPPPPLYAFASQVGPDASNGFRIQTRNRVRQRSIWATIGGFGWLAIALAVLRVVTWLFK